LRTQIDDGDTFLGRGRCHAREQRG
jgi:hypothetical protein